MGLAVFAFNKPVLRVDFGDEVDVLFQYGPDDQWKRREYQIVQRDIKIVVQRLSRVPIQKGEQVLREGEYHVLVEEVQNHLADSNVVPPPMDQ